MTRCGLPLGRVVSSALVTLSLVIVSLMTVLLVTVSPLLAAGPEISGLQAAVALEDVLVKAIAQAEKSVVAIARVKRNESASDAIDSRPDPFGQFRFNVPPKPDDPDFIPNDYATGVVVGNGLVLTAQHVLQENSDYWITTAGHATYKARVMAADPRSDLAVLAIDARDLIPIKFGDVTKLKKGQIVITLGNPYAIARDGQVSASWGIVANLARKDGPQLDRTTPSGLDKLKPALHQNGTLIQTDAKLNLGTSGGALVNLKGEMVGLTISLSAVLGYEQAAGFALPVDETFRRALELLKQGREVEYGFLGVSPALLSWDERASGKHGVLIKDIVHGTPAQRSGLSANDVVMQVNEQPVHDPDQLMLSLGKLPPEAEVRLTVAHHNGVVSTVPVQLAKYCVRGEKIVTVRPPAWRGVRVDYVTASKEFRDWTYHGRVDLDGSVLVTEVEPNSPAWNEGLRPDMMISHVENKRVITPKDFHEAVADKEGPVKLRLNLPAADRPVRTIAPDAS